MRRSFLALGAAALSFGTPTTMSVAAPALAPPNTADNLAHCRAQNPDPPDRFALGQCVALFAAFDLDNPGLPTQVCEFWDQTGQLETFGYDTFNQCVIGEHSSFVP
ncbi:MAG: hypothetical protein ACJ8FT_02265 [Sphingomonas sp.]